MSFANLEEEGRWGMVPSGNIDLFEYLCRVAPAVRACGSDDKIFDIFIVVALIESRRFLAPEARGSKSGYSSAAQRFSNFVKTEFLKSYINVGIFESNST